MPARLVDKVGLPVCRGITAKSGRVGVAVFHCLCVEVQIEIVFLGIFTIVYHWKLGCNNRYGWSLPSFLHRVGKPYWKTEGQSHRWWQSTSPTQNPNFSSWRCIWSHQASICGNPTGKLNCQILLSNVDIVNYSILYLNHVQILWFAVGLYCQAWIQGPKSSAPRVPKFGQVAP